MPPGGFMAHHKRRRAKHRRAGCLLCKPWKFTAVGKGVRRREKREALVHEARAG